MIKGAKRGRRGAQRFDAGPLRKLLHDKRIWAELAVVRRGPGASSHFRRSGDDVLVDVETVPGGLDLTCRLGSFAGGPGMGLWRIPAEGTEVSVLVASGAVDFMPTIVGTLSTGQIPARVQDGGTFLVAGDKIELVVGGRVVRVSGGNIDLGDGATQKAVKGDLLVSKLTTLLTTVFAPHNHAAAGAAPPSTAAAAATLAAELAQILSGTVRVE